MATLTLTEAQAERTCDNCGDVLPIENNTQSGYYCCGGHYCSEDCVAVGSLDQHETWAAHYEAMGGDESGECYWTEWEAGE